MDDNLRWTLALGITTVRDAAGADAWLRAAVDEGTLAGPRMQISVTMLSMTGGHNDAWLRSGGQGAFGVEYPGFPSGVCAGVEWPVLDTGTLATGALPTGALPAGVLVTGALGTGARGAEACGAEACGMEVCGAEATELETSEPVGGAMVAGDARASPAGPVIGMRVPQ